MHQVIEPLKSLNSVLSWRPSPEGEMTRSVIELSETYKRDRKAAKLLVCHDMKGGYIEDRFVEGSTDISYVFYHWQYVDVFVYFSHHLVTVPPPGWTNAAHRHGVKMLGTFITEWDDGKATCSQFLQSSRDFRGLANKMVDIMKYYRFDGWLVNIENIIQENLVNNLKEFVAYLTQRCHSEVEGSQVIWYDSVIKTGELKWQDQLNGENRTFFDACDGIFLNYCWNEDKLENSYKQASGNHRIHDVYVGVDVFGRGCPGGGGYNTCEAVSKIQKNNLSTAIFAPGWVYETQEVDCFTENQDRFWGLLQQYFTTSIRTCPFLSTSFCHGFGKKYFCKGEIVSNTHWYNMSLQQVQPCLTMEGQMSDVKMVAFTDNDGYLGGGCLQLSGQFRESVNLNLFQMDAPVSSPLFVTYTFKNLNTAGFKSVLKLKLSKSGQSCVLLLGEKKEEDETALEKKSRLDMEEVWVDEMVEESSFQTWRNVNGWITRCFHVNESLVSGWSLQTVCLGLTAGGTQPGESATFLLGQIQVHSGLWSSKCSVCNLSCSYLMQDTNVSQADTVLDLNKVDNGDTGSDLNSRGSNSDVTYVLKWEDPCLTEVQYYNVYHTVPNQGPKLVRQSVCLTCTVSLDRDTNNGELTVQTVSTQGFVVPIEDCPSCSLPK